MSCITSARPRVLEHHARQSAGTSAAPIYRMVADALRERNISGELIVDVGCGTGGLWPFVQDRFSRYVGVDGMRYAEFSEAIEFRQADLDREPVPMADHSADVVVAVEIIEHLENARAFVRDLVRITKPHGWGLITTPNQRSLLSLWRRSSSKGDSRPSRIRTTPPISPPCWMSTSSGWRRKTAWAPRRSSTAATGVSGLPRGTTHVA